MDTWTTIAIVNGQHHGNVLKAHLVRPISIYMDTDQVRLLSTLAVYWGQSSP